MSAAIHLVVNRLASRPAEPYGRRSAILAPSAFEAAYDEIASWPSYAPTPLLSLPGLAKRVGVAELVYKDEAGRFGLASFKALGGAYAVARVLIGELKRRGIAPAATSADLAAGRYQDAVAGITIASATDGNHGRAVAWGARLFGCRAVIFIHATVSEGRRAAIAAYGAEVVRVAGGYDDSVRHAFAEAARRGWHVVQDTAVGAYREVPADITAGYGVIAEELMRQHAQPPTHVLVQAGVGGVASAIAARFWIGWGDRRPTFIVLEPTRADCVARSLAAGRRVTLEGDTDTLMAGLACGEVSELAWDNLKDAADFALVIDDEWAADGMRKLAAPEPGDPVIVGGECSGGAIGALLALAGRDDLKCRLGIAAASRLLVIGTEGATDPDIYHRIVGRAASAVAASSRSPSS